MIVSSAPVRGQGKRHADHHDQRSDVHRVAHKAVQPRGHDRLLLLDGDRRCRIVVLDHHEFRHAESSHDQHVADHDDRRRHRRPAEPVVKGADHSCGDDRQHDADIDELLDHSGLCERPGTRPSSERIRIRDGQIDGRDHGADDEHGDENPSLPVVERARGPEQQQAEEHDAEYCVRQHLKSGLHDSSFEFSDCVAAAIDHARDKGQRAPRRRPSRPARRPNTPSAPWSGRPGTRRAAIGAAAAARRGTAK